jgi:hypothetical protein
MQNLNVIASIIPGDQLLMQYVRGLPTTAVHKKELLATFGRAKGVRVEWSGVEWSGVEREFICVVTCTVALERHCIVACTSVRHESE